ncbi:hypothetical protein BGZ79_006453 [Entomortierella chlamydospora]|nr:hypothetical protein BGZ79_006453 [Entomortierella chlamydospora]
MSIDLYRTPNLQLQDSGLTQKQRVLVALTMSLCFYLSLGSFVMMYIENWSFLDSLFFGLVTIATIGYGDYAPKTPGGRVFVVFYALGGIVLLAVVVNSIHYVIMEELQGRYLTRAKLREKKREERRLKRRGERDQEIRRRELGSEEGQSSHNQDILHQNPLELPSKRCHHDSGDYTHTEAGGREGAHNSDSTFAQKVGTRDDSTEASLEEVAPRSLEAVQECDGPSIPLQSPPYNSQHCGHEVAREGGLNRSPKLGSRSCRSINAIKAWWSRVTPFKRTTEQPTAATHVPTEKEQRIIENQQAYKEDMREYFIRFQISTAMFILFWIVGALLFMWVESWSFGTSMYFIVITFATIGYGDYSPKTKAGKIIFLVYVLLGVVTLTWLASLTSEILGNKMRNHVMKTQLKKEEKMKARGHLGRDLEEQGPTSEGGLENDTRSLIQSVNDDVGSISSDDTCEGSLHQLVKISKEFDQILHKASDVDHPRHKTGPSLPSSSGDIIGSLEKEGDESMGLLGPSLVRDIASTSSEEITDKEPESFPPHAHHHSEDDTVTVTANQWHHLIEYSKQFMNLTEAAEASLKKLIACETDESRRCQERRQIHIRQRRILRNRRNQLRDYDATPGLANSEVERELEELEELEDLEDDESLDEKQEESMERKRASIIVELMGKSRLNSQSSSLRVSNLRPSIQPSEDNRNIGEANSAPSNLLREAMKASPNRLHPLSLVMYLRERRRLRNQRNNNRKRSRTTRTEVLGRSMEEVTIQLEGRDVIGFSCSSSYMASIREDPHEQPVDNTQQDGDPGSSSSPRRISM